jgi:hypothetical protein
VCIISTTTATTPTATAASVGAFVHQVGVLLLKGLLQWIKVRGQEGNHHDSIGHEQHGRYKGGHGLSVSLADHTADGRPNYERRRTGRVQPAHGRRPFSAAIRKSRQ